MGYLGHYNQPHWRNPEVEPNVDNGVSVPRLSLYAIRSTLFV